MQTLTAILAEMREAEALTAILTEMLERSVARAAWLVRAGGGLMAQAQAPVETEAEATRDAGAGAGGRGRGATATSPALTRQHALALMLCQSKGLTAPDDPIVVPLDDEWLLALPITAGVTLLIELDDRTSLGLVRLHARRAVDAVRQALAWRGPASPSGSGPGGGNGSGAPAEVWAAPGWPWRGPGSR